MFLSLLNFSLCAVQKNMSFKSLQLEIKNLANIEIDFIELSENLTRGRTHHLTYM